MKQTLPEKRVQAQRKNGLAAKVQVFKASKGFLQLPEESIRQLALRAVPCQFKKAEMVFQEGDPCNYFYIVQKGRVKCFKESSSGKRLIILIGKRHETLNAGVLFGGQPHIYSAKTMEETTLLRVERKDYLSWVQENPMALQKVLALIEQALGSVYDKLLNIIGETVERRVYVVLYKLYIKFGSDLNFTCKEIGELAGTTTETVIRVISKLKKNQVVASTRRRIEILKPDEMKSLSHEQPQAHGWV
jgi:CRP/FNR family transcriptional regulator